jgi:hypothetical protein
MTMNPMLKIWSWQEGPVDRANEHFELRYGSAEHGGWSNWLPLAVIGSPKAGTVNVQFLLDAAEPKNAEAVCDVKKEIQFYLIEKGEPGPWAYSQYHCGTQSNFHSHVHWSYHPSAVNA